MRTARWFLPALLVLLAGTALLYFWGLTKNGYANSFYSAAAQAGSQSWKAFFYGSSDAGNSITVDKPPAALWFMALSVRLLGLSSFSILLPEVLMGIATVAVITRCVQRVAGEAAGLIAGATMALTPVAVLMFRFNNPDALLVLLMTLGAWATLRAIERGSVRWMALVGAFIGVAFLTKTLQAFLVVPFFGLAFLLFAATTLRRRILGLVAATLALVVTGGWWVAIVELVPASMRPYIGGSQNNSFLELTFGYNGLGRISGNETGSVGGGGAGRGGPAAGSTGILRLMGSELAGQISWLIPTALILVIAAVVVIGRAPRTDLRRASLMVWGGWFVVTALVFSFMAGIFHQYYTVALAPAIAAMVGIGWSVLWARRDQLRVRIVLAASVLAAGVCGFVILTQASAYGTWLRILVLVAGLLGAAGLMAIHRLARPLAAAVLAVSVLAGFAGQIAYDLTTVSTAKTGSIIVAGPNSAMGGMGGGMRGGPGGGGTPPGQNGQAQNAQSQNAPARNAQGQGQAGTGQQGGMPQAQGGMPPGQNGPMPNGQAQNGQSTSTQTQNGQSASTQTQNGQAQNSQAGQVTGGMGQDGGQGGGMSGLLNASTPSSKVVSALSKDADQYTWVAAAVGSQNAAGLQLATQDPVMAIGGFNGSDPSPTLAQFQQDVKAGKIHYLLASSGMGGQQNGGSDDASQILSWAKQNYTTVTIDGTTFYDLTQPTGDAS